MTDRSLEMLLRMVAEADDLALNRSAPIHAADLYAARTSERLRRRDWRLYVACGLAAAILAAFLIRPPRTAHVGGVAKMKLAGSVAVKLCYSPSFAKLDEPRIDLFQPVCEAGCAMLAIFREWNADCQCLSWTLHRWENGTAVADLPPGQPAEIGLNVSGDPPVEQVLVLAVARSREFLPSALEKADALLACLNESTVSPGPEHDVKAYTSAVERCLPEGITIVPEAFVVRSR